MRSKTSLTLAPTPHHHSKKASPSLQVKSRMGQLKFKTSTLTFNTPRKFLPNERKRKTAQKHTWSSSACWRCPTAAIEARFSSPMRTAYRFSYQAHVLAAYTRFGQSRHGMVLTFLLLHFFTKCRLKHVGVC